MKFGHLIFLLVCLPPLASQRTIVVDWTGGAGSHYKELDKAIAAAQEGDILLVRAGSYRWVSTTLDKGITVQGAGPTTRVIGRIRLDKIGIGRRFQLKDLALFDATIEVTNCAGAVLADQLRAATSGDSVRLSATSSLSVTMRRCGAMHVRANRAYVRVEGGELSSEYGSRSPTIDAFYSLIELADAKVTGGEFHIGHGFTQPTAALRATDSVICVRGSSSDIRVKPPTSLILPAAPVLTGDTLSRLDIDPVVSLFQPVFTAPVIVGFGKGVNRRALPTLRAPSTPVLDQLWSYSLEGKAGDLYAIALGLPTPPIPFLGGLLHIDPRALIVWNVGQLPASGEETFTIRHGNLATYRGELFVMQGVAGTVAVPTNGIAVSLR